MSQIATHTVAVQGGGRSTSHNVAITANKRIMISGLTITTGNTDVEYDIDIDVSQIKSIYMVSDKALLVETNTATAAESISLRANEPLQWYSNSYHDAPFTTDITALFLTNASGSTATLFLDVLVDPATSA